MPYSVPTRAEIEALLYASKKRHASKKDKLTKEERKSQVKGYLKKVEMTDEDIDVVLRDIESYHNWPDDDEEEVEVFE